ncbi:hypothetical protein F7230_02315 [Corynebacterium sp. 320]|uniref:hypothetical protein n=1 Tax=Corynebacterium TaxID=1716 RepID=UPI00125CB533|nr:MULTISPECIES: hypothetical protein [Corynebacterium]KAB1503960.1 hypothetical protein F7230_02315 [Corynebacterium sp. 320]KAB1552941.1 hypothetical protein F7233_04280 [Corynebacterium sp. 321]KAB1553839.1 hypothetical protein F7232_02300 [Corynebacterium sp. 319]KAB3528096.1 hypothetical protein F8354_02315 [Corynebacterium sp. 250]KAB3540416.1 hypothetical protein F8390_04025 [Corynebacterium sp. 366]
MGFFEDIAAALDDEGIESRFNHGTLFVPIAPELEIQFEEISAPISAANVFLARSDGWDADELNPEFDPALVAVVFSVDAAVEAVAQHIATDEIVSVLDSLVDSADDRLSDLDFEQDEHNPLQVTAPVAEHSHVVVELLSDAPELTAQVQFVTAGVEDEELEEEILELGVFHEVDQLFAALEVAAAQAQYWEELLVPLEDR